MTNPTLALGVSGSIAAYKAADLTSRLVKAGYNVVVIMTDHAQEMVTPITFLTLSRNPVVTTLFDLPEWKPGHIALTDQIDLFIVAPATANILAKMAQGIADDALSTALLSCTHPILVAPAMNPNMWQHPATQSNCEILKQRGVHFVGPGEGNLACGDSGIGRMSEPEVILQAIQNLIPSTSGNGL